MDNETTDQEMNPYRPPEAQIVDESEARKQQDLSTDGPVGVGGWLLFLCVSLTILSPLLSLVNISRGIQTIISFQGTGSPVVPMIAVDSIISISLLLFSFIAGLGLWRRGKNAVRDARTYLVVFFCYSFFAILEPLLFGFRGDGLRQMTTTIALGTLRSAVYVVIWHSYLSKSVRVKNTYGTGVIQPTA